jgi:hypothetical protein
MALLLIKAKLAMRYSRIDQGNVAQLAVDLQQEGHDVHFMPTLVSNEADIQLGYANFFDTLLLNALQAAINEIVLHLFQTFLVT